MVIPDEIKLKAIYIDRDGCINKLSDKSRYVSKIDDFHIYDDAIQFLNYFIPFNIEIAIVTNQQGIALGKVSQEFIEIAHQNVCEKCNTTSNRIKLYVCPHLESTCLCRKPKPGLLLRAAANAGLLPSECVFIGDSMTDYEAAKAAGMIFIGIDRDCKGIFDSVGIEAYLNLFELLEHENILNSFLT